MSVYQSSTLKSSKCSHHNNFYQYLADTDGCRCIFVHTCTHTHTRILSCNIFTKKINHVYRVEQHGQFVFHIRKEWKMRISPFLVTELKAGHCQHLCVWNRMCRYMLYVADQWSCLVELPCSYGFETLKGNTPLLQTWVTKQSSSVYVKFRFF